MAIHKKLGIPIVGKKNGIPVVKKNDLMKIISSDKSSSKKEVQSVYSLLCKNVKQRQKKDANFKLLPAQRSKHLEIIKEELKKNSVTPRSYNKFVREYVKSIEQSPSTQ